MIIHSPIVSGSLTFANGATLTPPSNSTYSGSFSGSFVGDGSNLAGVTSYTNSDTLTYINSLGVVSGSDQISLSGFNTSNLSENTNLYYTDARVKTKLNAEGVVSGSDQVTGELDTRYLNTNGDNAVSHSAQIDGTNIQNNFITLAGNQIGLNSSDVTFSKLAESSGVVSGSSQLTSSYDNRYLNVGGDGIISESSQVNANTITNFNSNVLSYNNSIGVVSGSSQLTSDYDTRYLNTVGDSVVSQSAQIDGTSISNNSITIAGTSTSLGDTITFSTIVAGTGTITGSQQVVLNDADKTGFDTDDVSEGANKYYTDSRVKTKLNTETVLSGSITSADITDVAAFSQSGTYASLRAQGTTKGDVGLGNVTNESKSTMFTSPTFTGTPVSTTPSSNDDSTKIATTAYVQQELTDLVGTAGSTLDTLGELSASLSDDSGSLASLVTTVGTKLAKSSNLSDLANASTARTNLGVAIGSDVQAYNSTLDTVSSGTYVGDNSIVTIGTVTSGNVTSILPSGVVSGSDQVQALGGVNNNTITFTAGAGLNGGGAITLNQSSDETVTFTVGDGVVSGSDQIATTFAQTILDDTSAGAVRTTIGVDVAGTDNSTNVTLVTTSHDYLVISGQAITLGTIQNDDLASSSISIDGTDVSLGGSVTTLQLGTSSTTALAGNTSLLQLGTSGTTALAGNTRTITNGEISNISTNLGKVGYTDALVKTKLNAETVISGSDQISLSGFNTSNLSENTNLYYTNARVKTKLNTEGVISGSASQGRSFLNVDVAGTDNSTDVTLGNTNYLSISGQAITGGTVPIGSGGTGATSVGAARTALGVDAAGTDNSTNVTIASGKDYITISGQELTLGSVDASSDISNLNTSNVSEGTNKYYTDARVKTKLNTETVISSSDQITSLGFSTTDNELTTEEVQDIVGGMLGGTETGITVTYQDTTNDIDFVVASQTDENFTTALKDKLDGIDTGAEVNRTDSQIKTSIGTGNGKFVPSAGTSGQFLKHDGTFGTPSYTTNTNTQLSNEQVQDIVGGMLGGTETGITVTYQDSTNDIDFVVASQTDNNFTTTLKDKLDGIEENAEVNLTPAEMRESIGTGNGNLVPAAGSSGEFLKHDGTFGTPSYTTNTNTQLSQEQVEDFVGGMLDGTETGITVGYNDTNGNIDFVVASQTDENFTTADHSKLDNIEAGADVTDTGNVHPILDAKLVLSGSITSADIDDVAAFSQSGTYGSLRAQGTTAGDVGLGNVTNESKATMFSGAALTNNPTAPTQTGTNDSTRIATTAFVQDRIDAVIGTAGSTLDTLGELSASLENDSGSLASLVTTVGGKLQKDQNLSDLTNAETARTNLGVDVSGTINYTLPLGTSSDRGGFKIGYSETGNNYPVELDSEKMYVNVPWTDNNDNTQLTNEQVQDIVGGMLGGTETGITVTYQDTTNDIDFVVASQTDNNFTNTLKDKLDGIEENANVTDSGNVVPILNANTVISGSAQITALGFSTTDNELTTEEVQDIVGGMVSGNTESGISVTYDDIGNSLDFSVTSQTDNNFTTALKDKLDGIDTSADVNRTDSQIKTSIGTGNGKFVPSAGTAGHFLKHDGTFGLPSYTTNTDTNTQLTQEQVEDFVGGMLDGTETGITVGYDDTNGNIDFVVASQTDNNFTTTLKDKLDGIESSADVNLTASETRTLIGTGNNGVIPSAGSSGQFLKHDGTFGTPSYTTNTDTNTQLSEEQVQDFVGNMLGGTQTGITVTYQDTTNDIDFVVASQTANDFTNTLKDKLDNIEASASVNLTASETRTLIGTGNNGVVPSAGTAGQFLKHDGTFGTPSYTTNTDTNTQLTTEQVQDIVGGMFSSNTETRISATYQDVDGTIDLVVNDMTANDNTQLSTDAVQDIVGAMFTGNTETRISAVYQDGDGTIDLVVNDMTANDNTQNTTSLSFVDSTNDIILRNTTGGAGSGTQDIKLVAGSNITLTHTDANNFTISSTDTNTVYSHPTEDGDDLSVDTGTLSGATVISDLDFNVNTNTLGHVTDATLTTLTTRDLTLSDLGYTGATDANNYVHPTYDGDDITLDTSNAQVIDTLTITTDTSGHVTDASVSTRDLTKANIGLGNVANESRATILAGNLTGTINSIAVATVTDGAALGASSNQDSTATIQSGTTATNVGLGNVTNESKATMFTSPTFTGTVSGVTATHVGLGNVTNESKSTMFASPTFTGTVSGVTSTHVGLGNVDNTSDANKPVSTAQQTALNLKANLASPALTGNPTAPTQTGTNSSTRLATTAFVQGRIDDIIGTAGSTLDTLGELSASLDSDSGSLASLVTTVGTKLAKSSNLSDLANAGTARSNLGLAGGSAGEFLKHDGTFGTPSYTTNTDTNDNTQNTYSTSVVSSSGIKLRLTGAGHDGATTDDVKFAGDGATTVTRTDASTITISSTDTNTTYTRASFINQDVDDDSDVTFASVRVDDATASTTKTTGALIVDGGVGIAGALNVGGDVVAYASSDERLKDNIELISNPIEKVQSLKGVTWNWNDNADELQQSLPNVGVIAQDVEKVLPQLVTDRDNGYKGVDYAKLTGLLIEAIKEQQKEIDILKEKLK